MTGVLIKRGKLNTDMHTGRTPREDEGRKWGEVAEAKDSQQTIRNHE